MADIAVVAVSFKGVLKDHVEKTLGKPIGRAQGQRPDFGGGRGRGGDVEAEVRRPAGPELGGASRAELPA